MIYWDIFVAFFIANLLGYGGGPSTIPLIQNEVVNHYEWMTLQEFGDLFAIANVLPGPIATKMGGYIGYQVGGVLGAIIALTATVLPSAVAVILLYKFVTLFKNSPQVSLMTKAVQPIIAILLGILAYQFFSSSFETIGVFHLLFLTLLGFLLMYKLKIHPALVIVIGLFYGGIFLS
ncbi:chromate transporter [Calidifontibacillus erzurumensis]|uniref:Chromate transporter n=1 Tax=Calidifontibacillus erzurumensis TaxID=2741433 RepID=A0A8J8GIP5_9BACI|nr:chromate transporter [Calidifontibacillus erzurumensis]NSL53088.1 chromate transporter [Calidifontibacillus erzurumensis]